MNKPVFCTVGNTKALQFAATKLHSWGYEVENSLTEKTTHFLLPVPTPPETIPHPIADNITVLGGNIGKISAHAVDLLQDPYYLAENASITAACAIQLLQDKTTLVGKSILIIGWGRIGKCLASQLSHLGAIVTVAVRKEGDCAILQALDVPALLLPLTDASHFDVIINTAPAPILEEKDTCTDAILMDLASVKGISGDRVLWARGLPGKMAPEASGALIAKTALRYALGKE